MSQFNWVYPTLLVAALITSVPIGSNQIAEAQTSVSGSGENLSGTFTKDNKQSGDNQPPVEGGTPPAGTRSLNPWTIVFKSVPKDNNPPLPTNPGSPRPMGNICAIAPKAIGDTKEVWNERPLFIWAGPFKRIELRRVGDEQVFWSKALDRQNKILYDGEPLQPGQTYEWSLYFSDDTEFPPFRTETFQVMDSQKRDRIQQDLQRLDETLKARKASTEEIARQHALYFVRQQLWLDALQEAYSVENPSEPLKQLIESMPKEICPKPSGQSAVQRR